VREQGSWLARAEAHGLQISAHLAKVLLDALPKAGYLAGQRGKIVGRRW